MGSRWYSGDMDPVAAEKLAARKMQWLGFGDAKVTGAGADGGLDVVAHDGVAQVKAWSNPVGVRDVRELKGVAASSVDAKVAVFFSTSGYTKQAIDFAQNANVALFVMTDSGSLTPKSGSAEKLLAGEMSADLKRAFEEREAAREEQERIRRDVREREHRQRQRESRETAIDEWARSNAALLKDVAGANLDELLERLAEPEPEMYQYLRDPSPLADEPAVSGSTEGDRTGDEVGPRDWPPDVLEAWRHARLDRQNSLDAWAREHAADRGTRAATIQGYEPWEVKEALDEARETLRHEGDPSILERDLEDLKWAQRSIRLRKLRNGVMLGWIGTAVLILFSMAITGGDLPEGALWLLMGSGGLIGGVVAYLWTA